MKYILGKKQKMTQIFNEEGAVVPVTTVQAGPVTVTQIKTLEKDGYDAVQVEYNKSRKEYRSAEDSIDVKEGDTITVSNFEEGDKIRVIATSKGKGFQGVVKRHGFHGGPRTHGQKHNERAGGSIGAGGLQRVIKGMKMPGRMGSDRVTVKSLKIVKVDPDTNTLYIKGAIPGKPGSLVEIVG